MKRRRSLGWYAVWALVGLWALAIGVQGYALWAVRAARSGSWPANYGNFERVRALLPAPKPDAPFTFVVVGDPRSKGTFEALAKDINAARPDFVVVLGDWVDAGSADWHAYFRWGSPKYGFTCPVFFTPGNHDVDPEKYPLKQFEADYGPRNFSFGYNDNLFIFISHLDSRFSNRESLDYLRSLDPAELKSYQRRFVFMHIPPWVSPDIKERHTVDENQLKQVFEDLGIDYVIAGDFHGYNRTRLGNVEYVVTGGGGGRLHESQGRQFHHAVALTLDANMVSERIIPISTSVYVGSWLEMNAIVYVGPFLIKYLNVFLGLNLIFACAFFLLYRKIRKFEFLK